MTQDNAIQWIGLEEYNQWRLENAKGEKISEFDSAEEDSAAAVGRLEGVLALLESGRYVLKAWKGKNRNAAASTFSFEVKKQMQSQSHLFGGNHQQNISFSEMMEKAKALALAEMEENKFKQDVRKELLALRSDVEDLKKVLSDLTDDDDDNDESALDRLEGIGTKLPGIMKGLDSMKSIFAK